MAPISWTLSRLPLTSIVLLLLVGNSFSTVTPCLNSILTTSTFTTKAAQVGNVAITITGTDIQGTITLWDSTPNVFQNAAVIFTNKGPTSADASITKLDSSANGLKSYTSAPQSLVEWCSANSSSITIYAIPFGYVYASSPTKSVLAQLDGGYYISKKGAVNWAMDIIITCNCAPTGATGFAAVDAPADAAPAAVAATPTSDVPVWLWGVVASLAAALAISLTVNVLQFAWRQPEHPYLEPGPRPDGSPFHGPKATPCSPPMFASPGLRHRPADARVLSFDGRNPELEARRATPTTDPH